MTKKILITGKNSYVGNQLDEWLNKEPEKYEVVKESVRDGKWKDINFSNFDVVIHVAGLAHADVENVSEEVKQSYFDINTKLTVEIAKKHKQDRGNIGSQFIFMSSIIVYGDKVSIGKKRIITSDTKPSPSNFYGDSKYQAELKLSVLTDENFSIAIVRSPMIYGPNSKGNYANLEKIIEILPFFPKVRNERSMIHIEKLCPYILNLINQMKSGIFFPQDSQYHCTSSLVKQIASNKGKHIFIIPGFEWVIKLMAFIPGKFGKLINKAFGNLVYDIKE